MLQKWAAKEPHTPGSVFDDAVNEQQLIALIFFISTFVVPCLEDSTAELPLIVVPRHPFSRHRPHCIRPYHHQQRHLLHFST
jgi:hypothetical protein